MTTVEIVSYVQTREINIDRILTRCFLVLNLGGRCVGYVHSSQRLALGRICAWLHPQAHRSSCGCPCVASVGTSASPLHPLIRIPIPRGLMTQHATEIGNR